MNRIKISCFAILLLFYGSACNTRTIEPVAVSLPRSVPEAEGVSTQGILDFLDAIAKSRHEFHSFMFLRHGRVIAEGWWNPYSPDLKQTMYSLSKSFTSTAVGFAVSEKRLTVNDKVISFFPEYLPDTVTQFLTAMKIKDLLCMSAGQDPDQTHIIVKNDSNWVKAFLALPVVNAPGTKFHYNSLATYMLAAIVQKVTGMKEMDYLTPRLFQPLGIQGIDWAVDPMGRNTGGWGLRIKTEDMAKFGQFYLQKGKWNNKQLLPEAWVEEATSVKIEQKPDAPQIMRDTSDWVQGYCYQFWRCRHQSFRGDGAYGQFIVVMPGQDAVVAFTSESHNLQDELNLVWKYLLPAMHKNNFPANKAAEEKLKQRLTTLALPLPHKVNDPPVALTISGKVFTFEPDERHLRNMLLRFMKDSCRVTLQIGQATYRLMFGSGKWIIGHTTKPGPDLFFGAKTHFDGLPPSKVAGCYSWKDKNTLELVLRYLESPHRETITCRFDKNTMLVDIRQSNTPDNREQVLMGKSAATCGVNSPQPMCDDKWLIRGIVRRASSIWARNSFSISFIFHRFSITAWPG
jgi:CubicO group peptidase (beta-lactamase class C family)